MKCFGGPLIEVSYSRISIAPNRQTTVQTDRYTNRQLERHTERHAQTDRYTDKQINRYTGLTVVE